MTPEAEAERDAKEAAETAAAELTASRIDDQGLAALIEFEENYSLYGSPFQRALHLEAAKRIRKSAS